MEVGGGLKELSVALGGGGKENEFELLIAGRWFIDRFDIEFPRLLMDDNDACCVEPLLVDHGFEVAAAPQFTELGVL